MSATNTSWTAIVTCPNGHAALQAFFDRSALSRRVREGAPISLYCRVCNRHRDATLADRATLYRALARAG
ncbi:MAG TPA: hypothetical protein VLI89_09920 [Burkholderiales bacterium]|nr:hypothetical protein [Burkholderiales bacterium]